MKLKIIGSVEITLLQGSLDNPNGTFIVSGVDANGDSCEFRFTADISPLGDLTGKHIESGGTIDVVTLKFESRF